MSTKGVYVLLLRISEPAKLRIGKLGILHFPKGLYAYVGSALGRGPSSLERRIERHLKVRKKKRWHIDFFIRHKSVRIEKIIALETASPKECNISRFIRDRFNAFGVKGFGSSDCRRRCGSHLYRLPDSSLNDVLEKMKGIREALGLSTSHILLREASP